MHVGRAEEHHRVEVDVAPAQAEVKDVAVVAGAPAPGRADHLAPDDRFAGADGRTGEKGVAGPQAAFVEDDDVEGNRRRFRRR
jgi:hypothetical protein